MQQERRRQAGLQLEVFHVPQAGLPPGTILDQVESYAGMRKVALGRTYPNGPLRILLNNKPILQLGLLDQARALQGA